MTAQTLTCPSRYSPFRITPIGSPPRVPGPLGGLRASLLREGAERAGPLSAAQKIFKQDLHLVVKRRPDSYHD